MNEARRHGGNTDFTVRSDCCTNPTERTLFRKTLYLNGYLFSKFKDNFI